MLLLLACLNAPALADEAPPLPPSQPPPPSEPDEPAPPDVEEGVPDPEGGFLAGVDLSRVPVNGLALEAGWGATQGGGPGGLVRVMLPHASVEVGMGLRLQQPRNLLAGGVSAHGYLYRDGHGPSLQAGLSTIAIGTRTTSAGTVRAAKLAPWAGLSWRDYLVERPTFALPLTVGVGIWSRRNQYGASESGFFFDITLGGQVPLRL